MPASGTVDIPQSLKTQLREFRLSASADEVSAFGARIYPAEGALEEDFAATLSLDELRERLPENRPRHVLLSYPPVHPNARSRTES